MGTEWNGTERIFNFRIYLFESEVKFWREADLIKIFWDLFLLPLVTNDGFL